MTSAAEQVLLALPMADGRPWGSVAVEWQKADALAFLDQSGPLYHWHGEPRGAGKTEGAARLGVTANLTQAPLGASSFVVAADADQAGLVLDSVRSFVLHRPDLKSVLRVEQRRVLFVKDGEARSSLTVVPADQWSAFGLRPWILIADELGNWPTTAGARGLWAAMVSALPKTPDARLLVATSAGDPSHWAYKVREQALSSPRWRVSEHPGPLEWVSESALEEQRALLLPSQYTRLHLNVWTAAEDRLATPEMVAACVGHEGRLAPVPGRRYVMGLDVGLVSDASVLTVGHAERRDGRLMVVVDVQAAWAGSKDRPVDLSALEATIVEAHHAYNRAELVFDPWQSALLSQRLRSRGISAREFTFSSSSVGRLALVLYRLLRDTALDLPDDEALIGELSRVQLVERQPGQYRLDHASGEHDDRTVSLALVAQALVDRDSGPVTVSIPSQGVRRPPIIRQSPSKRGMVQVGPFRVPAEHYRPPRQEGYQ